MSTRRAFFKQFLVQMVELKNDATGKDRIPLNRLHELPEEIIEQIEPVLFPSQELNTVTDSDLLTISSKSFSKHSYTFNQSEVEIFKLFNTHKTLKEIAAIISSSQNLSDDESYQKVTDLFFRLAAIRCCHPREFYNIDELKKLKNESRDVKV